MLTAYTDFRAPRVRIQVKGPPKVLYANMMDYSHRIHGTGIFTDIYG